MLSVLHQILVELFGRRPTLAPELLRDALGLALPSFDYVEVTNTDLSQVVPPEYRADQVLILRSRRSREAREARGSRAIRSSHGSHGHDDGGAGEPVMSIVLEVQLRTDEDKRFSWPCYQIIERARLRCPCCLLVVTSDESVAQWAATPIDTGQPGVAFAPLVLGPGTMPVITDANQARQRPELALLSVLAHGKSDRGYDVGMAAYHGAAGLDRETSMLYSDMILQAVNKAARKKMEEWMRIEDYEFRSDIALRGRAKGRAEGLEEGLEKGLEEGLEKGLEKGKAEGAAEALLKILTARELHITEKQKSKILGCTDLGLLDTWLDRVLQAANVDEILL